MCWLTYALPRTRYVQVFFCSGPVAKIGGMSPAPVASAPSALSAPSAPSAAPPATCAPAKKETSSGSGAYPRARLTICTQLPAAPASSTRNTLSSNLLKISRSFPSTALAMPRNFSRAAASCVIMGLPHTLPDVMTKMGKLAPPLPPLAPRLHSCAAAPPFARSPALVPSFALAARSETACKSKCCTGVLGNMTPNSLKPSATPLSSWVLVALS